MQNYKLKITELEGDTIEIYLDPVKHPVAYQAKKHELMHHAGLSENEAEYFIKNTPFVMEIFYSLGQGLFAIESEPLDSIEVFNPYDGKEVPNDKLVAYPENPLKDIDRITCEMENIRTDMQNFHADDKLTSEGEDVVENFISHLDEALAEIHKFTDPDDKIGLYEFEEEN